MAPNVHAINRWCVGVLRYRASTEEGVTIIIEFRSVLAEYCEIWERISFEIYMYEQRWTPRKDFNKRNTFIPRVFYSISSDRDSFRVTSMRKRACKLPLVETWRNSIGEAIEATDRFVCIPFRFSPDWQMFEREREREREDRNDESDAIKFDPVQLFTRPR